MAPVSCGAIVDVREPHYGPSWRQPHSAKPGGGCEACPIDVGLFAQTRRGSEDLRRTRHRSTLRPMAPDRGWSFPLPSDSVVLVEREVLEGAAIRVVERTAEGRWAFLDHRRLAEDRDLYPTALAGLVSEDPGLELVADLRLGWLAWRTARGSAWARTPIADAHHQVERRSQDEPSEYVAMVLDHEPGRLERLWLRLTWPLHRRGIRRQLARLRAERRDPPEPDKNDLEGTGAGVPRRPPDTPLGASVAVSEPSKGELG